MYLIISFIAGALCVVLYTRFKWGTIEQISEKLVRDGEEKLQVKKLEIQKNELLLLRTIEEKREKLLLEERSLITQQSRIKEKEEQLKIDLLKKDALNKERLFLKNEKERIAQLTADEAKQQIIHESLNDAKSSAQKYIDQSVKEAKETAKIKGAKILASVLQKIALPSTYEFTTTAIPLPSHALKKRLIGREGRNIRTLELLTDVNILTDETPGLITLSAFDPIKKEIAKKTIKYLFQDGQIHPTKIEEVVKIAQNETNQIIFSKGEEAAKSIGANNIHSELIILLGKLHFRYSLGQNLLNHSLEVAFIMGLMAEEIGLNAKMAKRIGLLHDIGKALSHEHLGSHARVGMDIAMKYGESEEVYNGIGSHHSEVEPLTVEATLCQTADAISATRPGARREHWESHIKRGENLEKIAREFEAIDRVMVLQAGKELRLFVYPDKIKDFQLTSLVQEIKERIQKEISSKNKVKITVSRESLVTDYVYDH
ncbi:ribonuclease Y [Chlamydiales bacterium]|nr:ribonuclease Y [Chlamydiales bacterium]